MNETIIVQIFLISCCLIGFLAGVRLLSRLYVTDKYISEAKKLQLKLNQARNVLQEMPMEKHKQSVATSDSIQGLVTQVLENPELLKEFGIDPGILKNPLIQGFVSGVMEKKQSQTINTDIGY